ncbi:MAG: regulatory protein RecX [Lachnospiraceae bacterium]|nr:regulatory protein RecX [Lachnospiraceae bacterium]
MRVTQIVELSKRRSKIYIEQEFAFVLYKGELRIYHIREGEEIAPEDYQRIMEEVLPKRAKLRAMNLLQSREYTTAQLRAKLKQGLYPEAVIEQALEYVAAFHYTDDARYAVDYITYHENSRSRRRMEQDLLAKGIAREVIEHAFADWEEQGGVQDEQTMIQNLLTKKKYDPAHTDYKEQNKLCAFLMRKGFSAEQIRKALGKSDFY